MPLFRGFIAIDIHATPQITAFETQIIKTGADVKCVEPENIHITLKFLGDTPENKIDDITQAIKESVAGHTPFPVTLRGTGVFPNQNYMKVIWIGIIDAGIIQTLAQTIDEKLHQIGFQKESRGFQPHLTIGRVKTAKNKNQLLTIIEQYKTMEFTTQTIDSVTLKKSQLTPQGPRYTTLQEVPL